MPGAPDRILLLGTVVTPDVSFVGQVLVEKDKITCAAAGDACSMQAGAAGATVITTNGVIAPGLIDTHNHILFDIFDGTDWLPSMSYTNHNDWTLPKNEPGYVAMLDVKQCLEDASQGKPTWCPAKWNGATNNLKCELDKWGELKGMIAGTTSIVGLPGTSSACFGSLSRSIDVSQNDLGVDLVRTSALFPPSAASATSVCNAYTAGTAKSYLVHCGEGTDAKAHAEFTTLQSLGTPAGCLMAPQTAVTHGTSFVAADFMAMAAAGVKLTWSPASNVALYGSTADIPAAKAAGVLIALGPDWSMGGSINMLTEMRFADAWDDAHFGNVLTTKDIVTMATINGAKVLGYDDRIGQIATGYMADLFVVSGDGSAPYDQIVAARPRDVRLVMVGGQVLYGDAVLQSAGPAAPGCETMDVCGASKFVCVAETSTANKLNQTKADIEQVLSDALTEIDGITDPTKGAFKFAPLAPLFNCE
jgi:cytosine/adenosine deaminase-related metal-dependent hydrolase